MPAEPQPQSPPVGAIIGTAICNGCWGRTIFSGWKTATWPETIPTPTSTPWPACAPDETILYVACDDESDEHYPALLKWRRNWRPSAPGRAGRTGCSPSPGPRAAIDEEGQRLPATYANFLVINGAVLVPTYRDEKRRRGAAGDRPGISGSCYPWSRLSPLDPGARLAALRDDAAADGTLGSGKAKTLN